MRWTIPLMLGTAIPLALTMASGIAAAQKDHDQLVQSLLTDARAAQSRGDFSQAAEAYRKAVALEPAIPELRANLGLMYHESGKHAEAIRSFEEATRLNSSLFAPQLFLGLEYLQTNKAEMALPYLQNAVRLNPRDAEAALSLGRAYEMLNQPDRAARSSFQATRLAPNNGKAWLQLGTSCLEEVESDARLMTSVWSNTPYVKLRAAELFAGEGKLGLADNAFRAAISVSLPAPCAHSEFGIVLLREGKDDEARKQFEIDIEGVSPCGLAPLGFAIADMAQGHEELALRALTSLADADPGFVRSNLPLFRSAISPDQAQAVIALARSRTTNDSSSVDIGSLIEHVFVAADVSVPASFDDEITAHTLPRQPESAAERLYASGHFAQCDEMLKPTMEELTPGAVEHLALCAFLTGDFITASLAGRRLKSHPATRLQGLYWESKADEQLATAALVRAGEIDPDSSGLHVLLGNAFRQQRHWSDAEGEYRRALSLDPANHAARLSLGIVLLTELKTEEALEVDKSLLAEVPQDAKANLLAAEILVQEHRFSDAEPYLSHCDTLEPELVPRVHILRGRIYAETSRISDAIAEYKLAISTDEDGSLHYQLARLYQKSGNRSAAADEMTLSQQLREKWDNQARLDLGQPLAGAGLQ